LTGQTFGDPSDLRGPSDHRDAVTAPRAGVRCARRSDDKTGAAGMPHRLTASFSMESAKSCAFSPNPKLFPTSTWWFPRA